MARSRDRQPEMEYEDYDYSASKRAEEFDSFAIKRPDGMSMMKIDKQGWLEFDILPYKVGKSNRHAREGKMFWQLSYYCHKFIGPDGKDVVCVRKMWDEPCPVCELYSDRRTKLDREDKVGYDNLKKIEAKDRQLFLAIDRLIARPAVQMLDYAYSGFGEALDSKLQAGTEANGYRTFWYLQGGKRIKALFEKTAIGGTGTFYKCKNIELEPRAEDIPVEMVKSMPCLDDCLVRLPYDRIAAILYGKKPGSVSAPTGGAVGNGEAAPERRSSYEVPAGKPNSKPAEKTEEPNDEPVNEAEKRGIEVGAWVKHDKLGRCEVKKISPDGSMLKLADEDGKDLGKKLTTDCTVAADEPTAVDDDDWDDAPPAAGKKR